MCFFKSSRVRVETIQELRQLQIISFDLKAYKKSGCSSSGKQNNFGDSIWFQLGMQKSKENITFACVRSRLSNCSQRCVLGCGGWFSGQRFVFDARWWNACLGMWVFHCMENMNAWERWGSLSQKSLWVHQGVKTRVFCWVWWDSSHESRAVTVGSFHSTRFLVDSSPIRRLVDKGALLASCHRV